MENKKFLKAMAIRAVKTFCQSAVSLITVGNALTDFNWLEIISISATAGVVSILTSIATGLPEVEDTADGK